ncbi:MAG: hypothetical protein HYR76_07900 [Ignavibacteria bacterium]|nr:hypothetical protein [Ignavibacteria bacterium]
MSIMMDIVGALVVFGMLLMTVLNVNINISDENYKTLTEFKIQTETIQLGRILEFDFYKIGYNVPKDTSRTGEKIQIADTARIKFYTNLFNVPGAKDSVEYDLGAAALGSTNPRDKQLIRFENITKVYINYSVTRFKLSYYNAKDSLLATPVTGAWRDSIKSVKVFLSLEGPEPFDTTRAGGYQYVSAAYQKLIYPRNL